MGPEDEITERLKFEFWPKVPGKEPREVVFDYLHSADEKKLRSRNYKPVTLRTLPVSSPEDVLLYNRYLMRGVIDGTVSFSKPRADALLLDMRHRQLLDRKGSAPLKRRLEDNADLQEILGWDESRHAAGNTTILTSDEMRDFFDRVSKREPETDDGN